MENGKTSDKTKVKEEKNDGKKKKKKMTLSKLFRIGRKSARITSKIIKVLSNRRDTDRWLGQKRR